jgi:acyl-coenzyme A thioesterase PaaI-like protein
VAFDDDIALTPTRDGVYEGEIADGWTTPRGPHGGYVMAMVLHAMELAIGDPQRQPRSLTVHFLRPPKLGPVTAEPSVERAGRTLSTATARLEQDGKPVALGVGAFSPAWDAPEVGDAPMPTGVEPPAELAAPLPGAPPFANQLAMQPRFGDAPLSGSTESQVGGWIDLRGPGALDGPALCVLADGWYPAIWPRLTELHAAPTIDLTVHFRAPLPVQGPLLARFTSQLARDGFFEEDGLLWAQDGTLVAQSRQLALLLG